MPSNHLILCCPLLRPPSISPSIRVFSNESALCIRWPKYWGFSFNISPSNEHPGLISFRMDWLDLPAVQGTLKSLLQHHSLKASILRHSAFFMILFFSISFLCITIVFPSPGNLSNPGIEPRSPTFQGDSLPAEPQGKPWCSAFFIVRLSHPNMTIGKTISLTRRTFVGKVIPLLFNMLSRLVITFLPRSKRLLISWLQSPSAVILETPPPHQ